MANHKSAKKRARQTIKKAGQNHSYISSVRTAVKGFKQAASDLATGVEKDIAKVQPLFVAAQSRIMKAASKGMMHKNTAGRTVGRLANLLAKSAEAAKSGAPAKVVAKKKVAKKKTSKKKTSKKK